MRKLPVTLLVLALVLCTTYLPGGSGGASVLGTSVVGSVFNETGAPFAGVQLRAVNVTTLVTYSAVSDAGGNYTLSVNPGLYNVTASYANYSANVSYVNTLVQLGREVRLNFTMSEVLCALTGYVTNGTTPIYGVTVTLINEERSYSAVSVNPLGQYDIYNVRPGTYTVLASKVGYYTSDPLPPVVMVRGVTKHMDFVLEEQPAELNGRVEYQGNGVKGVRVQLISVQFTTETVTDENGNYTFQMVPSGAYTITFSKDRYLPMSQSVGLSPFEVKVLNVELEYDNVNNTQTFILGLDLAHSLMIVGLVVSLVVLVVGLFINFKIKRKPEMLERREEGSEKE